MALCPSAQHTQDPIDLYLTMNSTLAPDAFTSMNGSAQQAFQFYIEPFPAQLVRFVLDAAIFLVGVLGNGLVCVVVIKENLLRSLAYCLIFNLAISDLGVILFSLPFAVLRTEEIRWPLGEFGCKVLYPLSDIFHGVSIASITAIAVFRYRGIISGHGISQKNAVKKAKIVIVLIWILSFILFVLPLFFVMAYGEFRGEPYCFPRFPSKLYYKLYQAETVLLTYLIPLGIILFTYLRIRGRLHESIALHSQIRRESCKHSRSRCASDRNYRALKVLAPVVIVFAVTMLPYNVFRVIDIFLDTAHFEYLLLFFKICVLCFVCNSSANPLIYALFSEEFRKAFKWHMRHCSLSRNRSRLFSISEKMTSFRRGRSFFPRTVSARKDRPSSSNSDVFV